MNVLRNEGSVFGQVFRGVWGSPSQDGQDVLGVPGLTGLNRPTLAWLRTSFTSASWRH